MVITSPPLRLIDDTGHAVPQAESGGFVLPPLATLLRLYRQMVVARRFEAQVTALTRQGRLATYPSALGQEACEIAAVASLRTDDWLFPTYRDSSALLTRGVPPEQILASFRGDWHSGYDQRAHHIAPQATPLATQALHAVGLATAAKLTRDSIVALTLLGDGATSEGDAHEAFNFAAVWQAPVVFLVQNNQFAISVPLDKQMACRTIADKAIGYGMPGYYVDGNDVAAMYAVVTAAIERARSGNGPTLIEGLTYRIEAHTNSDDPSRYRNAADVDVWRGRDPIERLEKYLVSEGALSEAERSSIEAEAEKLAATTRECMTRQATPDPLELFDHVYATPRTALAEQRSLLVAELAVMNDQAVINTPVTQPLRADEEGPAGDGASVTETAGSARVETPHAETLSLAAALTAAIRDAMVEDPTVVLFGEDVGPLGGVFRVTDGLYAEFGETRVSDAPLAESGIVGTAIGMAIYGMRPVVEMQFDAFSYPAFQQIVSHVAKMRNRTRGAISLPLVIRIPYAGDIGGLEHHSDSSEGYWAATPGLTVVTPSNPADAYSMLREAIRSDDPVIFMEPKSRYWNKAELTLPAQTAPMTRAVVLRTGTDVTLLAYGPTVKTALATAEQGAEEGLSIEVIDLRSLSPFDDATVSVSLRKTGRVAVLHEAAQFGGYGAEVAARLTERNFFYLAAPILRITGFDIPYPAPKLEEYFLPSPDRILAALASWEWSQ
jgi:pyruvate dehydrogenase E1 component alpha subunit